MQQPQLVYLKGTVVPGLFTNERIFTVRIGSQTVSIYADRQDVFEEGAGSLEKRGEGPASLRVYALGEEGGRVRVLLRQEAGTGERTLLVGSHQVEYGK